MTSKLFKKAVFYGLFLLLLLFNRGVIVASEDASLSVFPQAGTFTIGSTFDVSVFVNTAGNNINAVKVGLEFDPKKIQVVTPAKGLSLISQWTFPPSFSNDKGTINLEGGFPRDGINISEGLVAIIVFKAIASGETSLKFSDSSMVLLNDAKGSNILSSYNMGNFNIIPSPPTGPQIFSKTHPDQNRWYKNPNPSFYWESADIETDYSYEINDDPYGEPDNISDTKSSFTSFENVSEGVQYFHLKARLGKIWGGTSHFKLMIDKTPPVDFEPFLESSSFTNNGSLLIYFVTTDALSGIEHYEVRTANITDPKNFIFSAWQQEESPFKVSTKISGAYEFSVRAFDSAGNFREEKIKIRLINPNLILYKQGIKINGLSLPFWMLYSITIIILLAIVYWSYRFFRPKIEKNKITEINLYKEIKEAEKEIEDVKLAEEKLRQMRLNEENAHQAYEKLKEELDKEINKS